MTIWQVKLLDHESMFASVAQINFTCLPNLVQRCIDRRPSIHSREQMVAHKAKSHFEYHAYFSDEINVIIYQISPQSASFSLIHGWIRTDIIQGFLMENHNQRTVDDHRTYVTKIFLSHKITWPGWSITSRNTRAMVMSQTLGCIVVRH